MKEKISRLINKNIKWILIFGIVIVLAFGALLMLISGNDEERDQVPIDPTAEQTDDKKDRKERKLAESTDHPGVSDIALNMYNARVDDISDTAQVAQLLEATDMRTELGDYLVTLELKDNQDILVINYDKKLKSGEDAAFDEVATWYAEQFIALIEEADEVQWTYSLEKDQATIDKEKAAAEKEAVKKQKDSDGEEKKSEEKIVIDEFKKVEKSLTTKQANELLDIDDIKTYSETPELVQTLLNNQKGIV